MQNDREELQRFKSDINLTLYAASKGYSLDRKSTSRNSAVMSRADRDKIVIGKGKDGNWIFFSVHDPADNGSIIDFVANRDKISLGRVRQELRYFLSNGPNSSLEAFEFLDDLEPISRDLGSVRAAWAAMEPLPFGQHHYLNEVRKIPSQLLALPFFEDRIRVDARGNAAFQHFDRDGISGFELKNDKFTGFAKHGTKGLWGSRTHAEDNRLAICETAIDAVSYAQLFGHERLRIASTAGSLNPEQPDYLLSAMRKLPRGQIISAVDHDEAGDQLHAKLAEIFMRADRADLEFIEHRADKPGSDWNDQLCYSQA